MIYLFNRILIDYSIKLLEVRNEIFPKIAPFILALISITLIYRKTYLPILYVILFLAYMILFKIMFEADLREIYVIIVHQIFLLILFRDINLVILSLLTGNSIYETIQCFETYVLSFALCRLIMITLAFHLENVANLEVAKKLLVNKNKLRMSDLAVVGLIIILLNSNHTYYYLGNMKLTLLITLINRICIAFCFCFLLNMKIKTIKWVEEEVLYKTTVFSLEQNEKINKTITEYSELLKIYNHDFKKILFNIKDSIDMGNTEQAKAIIAQFDERVRQVSSGNKMLSNRHLINSLLSRLKDECDCYNISFDADCYIPNNFEISDIDLISIFNNLSSNALEAVMKQEPSEKRWITFKSYIKGSFLIIYQSNSFNGAIKFKNNRLITTKQNKKSHGIGVESIKFIVEKSKGMNLIKIDEEKREFNFLIKIPITQSDESFINGSD